MKEETRRNFIKKASCALGMVTLATQVEHFGLMTALAQKVKTDRARKSNLGGSYKALVCVFLGGGNDGNNMIVPNHNDSSVSNYSVYAAARSAQGLAIPQNQLLPITVPRMGNLSYGLNANLGTVTNGVNNGIYELWGQGKMAFVTNVGTLASPMTKTQYQNNSVPKPFQLFSHSDQVSQFHAGRSDAFSFTGWGGRTSDKMTAGSNPNGLIPMITSISGAQLFTSGQITQPLAIGDSSTPLNQVLNPIGFGDDSISQARLQSYKDLHGIDLDSNYVEAASAVTDAALQANDALASFQEVTVTFPNTSTGRQLKQVARMIKKQSGLNVDRQIFYVERGGFDTHASQLNNQSNRLSEVSQAVRSFYDEMVTQGMANNVTILMMTDFGRTMNPAGTGGVVGSDHAWGNHLFVIGDSVIGGDFYGVNTSNGTPFPNLLIDGPDDATSNSSNARGRWIPTTSVEQYAATLARWYGLPENQMSTVFPNIGSFTNTNLGFMQP